jgi:hypothetical protein
MVLLLAGLVLAGCTEQEPEIPVSQPVLFQYRYVNFAWGYQEYGWLIDHEGRVRTFRMPEGFRMPDSTGLISEEDLFHNLSLTDSTICLIDKKELEYYAGLIQAAAHGETGKARNIAYDAGRSVLSCYLYMETEGAYRYVFLGESGDWQQSNLSPEARILVKWLRKFGVFWLS